MNLSRIKSIDLFDGKTKVGTLDNILKVGKYKTVEEAIASINHNVDIFASDMRLPVTKIVLNLKEGK